MANPQLENGHFHISNEIIEALAKHVISPDEWRCLMVIFRKTWGWQKKEDKIALSTFVLMTSMRKPNICRALSRLQKKKIIIRTDNADGTLYRFQKDFDQWKSLSKQITVIQTDNKSLSKQRPSKENKKKNTLRDSPNPAVRDFLTAFQEAFKEKTGQPYTPHWAKEGKLIKDLLKIHSLDRLKELAALFFCSDDKFIQESGRSISVFYSQINKLAAAKVSRW